MKNFESKIAEIEAVFQTQDADMRTELRGTQEALQAAEGRLEALETSYKAALIKNSPDATKLRVEVEVARDSAALLTEMVDQLRADLNTGEAIEARLRRHSAIVAAVEGEGNAAIAQAISACEAARDMYKSALENMVKTQHAVADTGRRSVFLTSQTGRPCNAPTVLRYSSSEFEVEEPAQSASAAPIL